MLHCDAVTTMSDIHVVELSLCSVLHFYECGSPITLHCCSVLQCVVVCCIAMNVVALSLFMVAVCCSVLQCDAVTTMSHLYVVVL